MNANAKIFIALKFIQDTFTRKITSYKKDEDRPVISIYFNIGINLHIRYNDHEEYSYQIMFSQDKFDRIRYDNFDDHWSISTKPHHVHKRGKKEATESKMTGQPECDMPLLIEVLRIYLLHE